MTEKIHIDTIKAAARALSQLPKIAPKEPEHVGKMQALQALKSDIRSLRSKGYSFREVAHELSKLGIEVSESAVKRSQNEQVNKPTNRSVKKLAPIATNAQQDNFAPAQPDNPPLIDFANRGVYANN
jgi:hypothetical protein